MHANMYLCVDLLDERGNLLQRRVQPATTSQFDTRTVDKATTSARNAHVSIDNTTYPHITLIAPCVYLELLGRDMGATVLIQSVVAVIAVEHAQQEGACLRACGVNDIVIDHVMYVGD